jgi:hypothetical protein
VGWHNRYLHHHRRGPGWDLHAGHRLTPNRLTAIYDGPVGLIGTLQDHLLLMRDPYARRAITLLAGRIDRLEEGMATFDQDVTALITAVKDNAQATADLATRVKDDMAKLSAQIAAGNTPDPALLASLEAQTAAIHANTSALAAIDPSAPTPPPPPQTVPAPTDTPVPPTPTPPAG